MRFFHAYPVVLCLLLSGCGYRFASFDKSVEVHVFDNQTERRIHEVDLTKRINQSLQRRGIRVRDGGSYILRGEIRKIYQDVAAVGKLDEVIAGTVEFFVEFEVIERKTGSSLLKKLISSRASFSPSRNRTESSAFSEIFQEIGNIIATQISEL